MDLHDLTFEAFGSGRLQIVEALLRDGPLRYARLAERLDASAGELSRNLGRLQEAGLLTKDASGAFEPTPLARAAFALSPPLRTLARHGPFFREHDVSALPPAFLRRLDDLDGATLVTDAFAVFGAFERLVAGVERSFFGQWVIGKEVFTREEIAAQQVLRERIVRHGSDARGILVADEIPRMEKVAPGFAGYCRVRLRDSVPACVGASDRTAILQLPDASGRVDFNYAFVGDDPRFVAWCRDLFLDAWESARDLK